MTYPKKHLAYIFLSLVISFSALGATTPKNEIECNKASVECSGEKMKSKIISETSSPVSTKENIEIEGR